MKDNTLEHRFELEENDHTVFADYRRDGDTLYISHVEAPPPLRGTGAAGRLMQHIADMAHQEKLTIVPMCSYAAAWLQRHPEHHALIRR